MIGHRRWFFFLLILVTLGCGPAPAAEVGEVAPAFSILSFEGKRLEYQGPGDGDPLLLLFWATWCPNCAREMPKLAEIFPRLEKEGLRVMGINVGINDSQQRARSFAGRHGLNYPLAFDENSRVSRIFGIWGVPTVILIDGEGLVRYRRPLVPRDLPEVVKALRGTVAQEAPSEAGIGTAEN